MAAPNQNNRGRVQVIGDIQIDNADTNFALQPGQRQLLAILVAVGPGGATPDQLADEIWGENLPRNWPNSLRVAIHRLRKRAGLPVTSKGGRYRLELETTAVDSWLLLDTVKQAKEWHDSMQHLLSSPLYFRSVEPSISILEASTNMAAAQRQLIETLAAVAVPHPRQFLSQLMAHVIDDPTDDRLVQAVAAVHFHSGASADALGLVDRCRQERRRVFDAGISLELEALENNIRSSSAAVQPTSPPLARRQLPTRLERYRRKELLGRDREVEKIRARITGEDSPSVVIHGPAGIGKTALLAEIAHGLSADAHMIYLAGAETNTIGLSPLTTAIPGFADHVDRAVAQEHDQVNRLRRLAHRLIELTDAPTSSRALYLLIDDAQWLDSQTCELLDYLVRTESGRRLHAVIVAAREGQDGHTPWLALENTLERLTNLSSIDLAPLTAADVESLLGRFEPMLSFTTRHQKAEWLHKASGGLPEVVRRMIELDDSEVSGSTDTVRVFDRLISSLDPEPRALGVAAAVMGRRFRLSDLAELLNHAEDHLSDVLDVLIRLDLVLETGSFDHFEFCHDLLVDAFLRSTTKSRLARLHLHACALSTDIHALSRHQVASETLIDSAVTLQTILDSAEQHLINRQFWESTKEFRIAHGQSDNELSPQTFVNYATALSLSGARSASRSVRERAYAAAVAANDSDLAVEAACSGLPEAEVPDGEADRLEQLEGISPNRLTQSYRHKQALTAARLASQLGQVERAQYWVDQASSAAVTDQQTAEAALCRRFIQMVDCPAGERLHDLDLAVRPLALSPNQQCRASQFRAVDHLEMRAFHQSETEHTTFHDLAIETDDPLRQWHALVFGALLREVRGNFREADKLATAAQELGRRQAIAQAEIVRVAQHFFRLEALGQLENLVDMLGLVPVSDAESTLFNAATTRVLHAAGRRDESIELAGDLAVELLERPSVTSHGSIALIAPVLAGHPSAELKARAMTALRPSRHGGLVLGVGLGFLPSIEHLWMLLNDNSPNGREQALIQAIKDCDRDGLTTWSVRYRLDLSELTGSKRWETEARQLAKSTDLAELFGEVAA